MAIAEKPRTSSPVLSLLTIFVVVAALHFGREIFIPLALAALLGFLLVPIVVRLRRWGFGRIPAVLTTVILAFTFIFIVGAIVTVQINELSNELPHYQFNIEKKISAFKKPGGALERLSAMVRELHQQVTEKTPPEQETPAQPSKPVEPIPVEVHQPEPTPLQVIGNLLWSLVGPFAMAGIVIVFVIFMLIEREDLRDRVIRLFGAGRLQLTTQALDDAAERVSRYLLLLFLVNSTYGIPIGIGLYFIGVPSPVLWGLLAMLLRFIPYVGPIVAAFFPIVLAFAVDPGWTMPLLTIGLFLVVELFVNSFMEPWLYGTRTGISSLAVLIAAVFWTWVWGPIGLFVSTPLTVCLVVIGRYFPQLEFLNILFGDEPVLPPEARFYQRMLAMEQDEATELAEEYLEKNSLASLYDQVIVPALHLAERDHYHGELNETRHHHVIQSTRDLVEYLGEREDEQKNVLDKTEQANKPVHQNAPKHEPVLCIPAMDEADEIVAMMFAQLLQQRGIAAKALAMRLTTLESLEEVGQEKVETACVSALPPLAILHARYLCRRLRSRFPHLKLLAGIWNINPQEGNLQKRIAAIPADGVVTSLMGAVEQIEAILSASVSQPATQATASVVGGTSSG